MDQMVKKSPEKEKACDMACMMEEYKKVGAPGEQHKMLESRTGKWRVKSRHYMDPAQPPMESSGECDRKMILGGRYMQEEFSGDMMGEPFNGIGVFGYNNHTKKYFSTWMDSMSTGLYFFEGTGSPDGKTMSLEGHFNDPVKGDVTWRLTSTIKDADHETFEMKTITKDGKEEKCEMTYERA